MIPKNGLLLADNRSEPFDLPPGSDARRWQNEALIEFRRKFRLARGGYFTFLAAAGVGSGKTVLAAMVAAYLLNRRAVGRVVYVCPNRAIRRRVAEEFRRLNIHLVRWNREKHRDGDIGHHHGIIVTYQALIRDHAIHAGLCDEKTLVIFDEIHHLGDNLSWGTAAEAAFKDRAACVLGLSGTPYRGDNRPIPFVEREPEENGICRFRPDFAYTLGRAILEGVCRKPVFHWLDGQVKVKLIEGGHRVVDFNEELPAPIANRRLNGAVMHGSVSRSKALSLAVEFCRRTRRKLIIFVGGDSNRKNAGGVRDATEYLPAELRTLGIRPEEMCSVVAEDSLAAEKIGEFGKPGSTPWIMVAVNMVSEGVDIPPLSAALFLTCITARATTIQRIGRVVRGEGEAHIFMFGDPRYREIADAIEAEVNYEIDLGRVPTGATPPAGGSGERADGDPVAIGLDCYEDGITVSGVRYSREVLRKYQDVIREKNMPENTPLYIMLPLIVEGHYGAVQGEGDDR